MALRVPNRVVLAPLAGIGNWFVRLQARRYGAGMVVSEMVSSSRSTTATRRPARAAAHRPARARRRPGLDPAVRRGPRRDALGRRDVAAAGRRPDRHQHGLPGAEGLPDRRRRRAARRPRPRGRGGARAAEGGGQRLPVTVKLRSGLRAGERQRLRARAPAGRRGGRRRDHASTRAPPRSTTGRAPTTRSPRGSCATLGARDPQRRAQRRRRRARRASSRPAPPR